jgi:dye decolorizing peroxidase
MGCPFRDEGELDASDSQRRGDVTDSRGADRRDRGIDRRSFVKSALAIGGAGALSTVTGLYGMPDAVSAEGTDWISARARDNRQHAWDGFETNTSVGGVSAHPSHHVTLHLDYAAGGTPSPDHRREVEAALREVERHFEWSSEGVLFTVGYSPNYFDRFEADLPDGLSPKGKVVKPGLLRPEQLIDTPGVTLGHEDPAPDEAEVCLHFASNNAQNIMAAEELLWGGAVEVDGETLSFDATVAGILETAGEGSGKPTEFPYRRVGFSGHENISENLEGDTDFDPERIPDDAELMMGFNDLYRNSIPREDNATILEDQRLVEPHPPGQFAQGTVQHVSKLDIDLDRFYDRNDEQRRRELMFSADHNEENTGTVGENLGESNAPGDTPMRDLDGEADDKAEQVVDD